jgi:MFS family permease
MQASGRFAKRDFNFLWLTYLLATFAQEFSTISIIVLAFGNTGSALQATGAVVARNLPPLLFGPLVGSIVDRMSRRHVLIASNLFRVVWVALFLWLSNSPFNSLWLGYLLVFGLTMAEILHKPALMALLPATVPNERLVWANSFLFTTSQVVFIISYLLGGLVSAQVGPNILAICNLLLFGLAAASAFGISKEPPEHRSAAQEHVWQNILAGFSYLRKHPLARSLVLVEFLESWPHSIWSSALMLTFTIQALGAGFDAWGYQSGAYFAGQFAGALLALTISQHLGRYPGWIIIANGFVMSALTFGYAISQSVLAAVLISAAFGPPFALRDVAQDSLIQTRVAPNMLGRIYALRDTFARLAMLVGGLIFAAIADTIGIRWLYLLGGLLYLLVAFYTFWSSEIRTSRVSVQAKSA